MEKMKIIILSHQYNCLYSEFDIIKSNTKLSIIIIINDNYFQTIINSKSLYFTHFIQGEDFDIIVYSINIFVQDSSINVDFSNCLNIHKISNPNNEYHLAQMNMKNNALNNLIHNVEYKFYDENSNEVDLSPCNDVKIEVKYKIQNISAINLEQIIFFAEIGIDVFNIHDEFFNDICYPYSDFKSDSDIILKDRVKDIYQNYSIWEEGCEYNSFNITEVSVKCDCKMKKDIKGDQNLNLKHIYYLLFYIQIFVSLNVINFFLA